MLEISPPQFPCAKVRFARVSKVYSNFKSNLHCLINVYVVDNDVLTCIRNVAQKRQREQKQTHLFKTGQQKRLDS